MPLPPITPLRRVYGNPNSRDELKRMHDTYKNIEIGLNPDSGVDPNTLGQHIRKCKNIRKGVQLSTVEDWTSYRRLCAGFIEASNQVISKMKSLDSLTGHVKKDKENKPVMVPVTDSDSSEPQYTTVPRHTSKIEQFYEIISDCQKEYDEATANIARLTHNPLPSADHVKKRIEFTQQIERFLLSALP